VLFDKLDTAKMHGLDTLNVSSRDVMSQVEFGLYINTISSHRRSNLCLNANMQMLKFCAPYNSVNRGEDKIMRFSYSLCYDILIMWFRDLELALNC